MTGVLERLKVHFSSEGERCAAWHYPGTNGACVVMAGGLGVTKEPATDPLARKLHEAGFTVLAFDFRRLGESEGQPRQIVRMGEQLADLRAAIAFARTLPRVDPTKVAVWGFSLSGGHVFRVAAEEVGLAAAIAHAPLADGVAASPNALRHQSFFATMSLILRALMDVVGGWFGRAPLLVPLAAPRGTVAALSTPDSLNGSPALNPNGRYPTWSQVVAARSAFRLGFYRPGRFAARARCPLLLLAYDGDGVSPPEPAIRAVARAPRGEVVRLPGGHYEAFLGGQERAVATMVEFLRRHLTVELSPPIS